jgi:RNA polymerase sigma-70 factor (ECF subfamily)
VARGETDLGKSLDELGKPDSEWTRQWDEEHNRHVARRLCELIAVEFEPATQRAFHRLVLEGAPAKAVAAELGLSINAVYIAKSRVLQRLRQEIQGLID